MLSAVSLMLTLSQNVCSCYHFSFVLVSRCCTVAVIIPVNQPVCCPYTSDGGFDFEFVGNGFTTNVGLA